MQTTINGAKAFLSGAGFGRVIYLLDEEEIKFLTKKRMSEMGMTVEFIEEESE